MGDSQMRCEEFAKYPRAVGMVLALLGALFFYWMIVQPIQQAEANTPEIRISLGGGTLGIALIFIGLVFAIFGAYFAEVFDPPPGESKVPAYTVAVLLVMIGIVIYIALQGYLESKGYVIMK